MLRMSKNLDALCGYNSSDDEPTDEVLDKCFENQVSVLRELSMLHMNRKEISLCAKWLNIFGKTSKEEKLARNCLMDILRKQLEQDGKLGRPFTDPRNCNRELTLVLHDCQLAHEAHEKEYMMQQKQLQREKYYEEQLKQKKGAPYVKLKAEKLENVTMEHSEKEKNLHLSKSQIRKDNCEQAKTSNQVAHCTTQVGPTHAASMEKPKPLKKVSVTADRLKEKPTLPQNSFNSQKGVFCKAVNCKHDICKSQKVSKELLENIKSFTKIIKPEQLTDYRKASVMNQPQVSVTRNNRRSKVESFKRINMSSVSKNIPCIRTKPNAQISKILNSVDTVQKQLHIETNKKITAERHQMPLWLGHERSENLHHSADQRKSQNTIPSTVRSSHKDLSVAFNRSSTKSKQKEIPSTKAVVEEPINIRLPLTLSNISWVCPKYQTPNLVCSESQTPTVVSLENQLAARVSSVYQKLPEVSGKQHMNCTSEFEALHARNWSLRRQLDDMCLKTKATHIGNVHLNTRLIRRHYEDLQFNKYVEELISQLLHSVGHLIDEMEIHLKKLQKKMSKGKNYVNGENGILQYGLKSTTTSKKKKPSKCAGAKEQWKFCAIRLASQPKVLHNHNRHLQLSPKFSTSGLQQSGSGRIKEQQITMALSDVELGLLPFGVFRTLYAALLNEGVWLPSTLKRGIGTRLSAWRNNIRFDIAVIDAQFDAALNKQFEVFFEGRKATLVRQLTEMNEEKRNELSVRFSSRLHANASHAHQKRRYARIQCFSKLRAIFLEMYDVSEKEPWQLLEHIEEKYKTAAR